MSAPHSRTGDAARDRGGFAPRVHVPATRSPSVGWRSASPIHAATAALSAALTPAEVVSAIASCGAALQGACGCAVALLQPEGFLEVSAVRGAAEPQPRTAAQ